MNKTKLAVMAAVMAGSIGIGMIGCVANQSNVDTESKTVQKSKASSEKKASTNEKTTDSDKDSKKTADAENQDTSDNKKKRFTEKTVETKNTDSAPKDGSNQKTADSKTEQADSQTAGNKTESKPTSNNKPSSSSSSSGTNKPSGSSSNSNSSNKPSTNTHSHSWEPVYKTVYHPEEGHNEQYVITESWTEQIPIYGISEREICNGCGVDMTDWSFEQMKQHTISNIDTNPMCGAWHSEIIQVITGYETINHPAEYGTRWVVDKAAWSEKVVSGYKCSCGATK